NGLVSDSVLQNSGATQLSVFQGKQYRVGFYTVGFGLEYNKDLYDKAGLNADSPPKTFDELLNACDKLKSKGIQPIGGGVKDGFGIPTKGNDHEQAARFPEFMHSPEQVKAMWTISQQIPANTSFDGSIIDDPLLQTIQKNWVVGDHNVYIADLMPTKFWTDAMFVISQKILAGDMTGEQSGDLADQVTQTWKKQNPSEVDKYKQWSQDLASA